MVSIPAQRLGFPGLLRLKGREKKGCGLPARSTYRCSRSTESEIRGGGLGGWEAQWWWQLWMNHLQEKQTSMQNPLTHSTTLWLEQVWIFVRPRAMTAYAGQERMSVQHQCRPETKGAGPAQHSPSTINELSHCSLPLPANSEPASLPGYPAKR